MKGISRTTFHNIVIKWGMINIYDPGGRIWNVNLLFSKGIVISISSYNVTFLV